MKSRSPLAWEDRQSRWKCSQALSLCGWFYYHECAWDSDKSSKNTWEYHPRFLVFESGFPLTSLDCQLRIILLLYGLCYLLIQSDRCTWRSKDDLSSEVSRFPSHIQLFREASYHLNAFLVFSRRNWHCLSQLDRLSPMLHYQELLSIDSP